MSYKGYLSRLTHFFNHKKRELSVFSVLSVVGVATGIIEVSTFVTFWAGIAMGAKYFDTPPLKAGKTSSPDKDTILITFSDLQNELLRTKEGTKKYYSDKGYNFLHIIATCSDLSDPKNSKKYAAIVRGYSSKKIDAALLQRSIETKRGLGLTPSELAKKFYGDAHKKFFDQWVDTLLQKIRQNESSHRAKSDDVQNRFSSVPLSPGFW